MGPLFKDSDGLGGCLKSLESWKWHNFLDSYSNGTSEVYIPTHMLKLDFDRVVQQPIRWWNKKDTLLRRFGKTSRAFK